MKNLDMESEDPNDSLETQDDPSGDVKAPDKYELDNHVKTLVDAHALLNNKPLMKHVQKHAAGKARVVKTLSELKGIASKIPMGMDKQEKVV